MKRKMAVIVAAEVDDYIGLLSGLTGPALAEFSNQSNVLAKSAASHGGRVFSASGGSSMLEFASAVEAVRWASWVIDRTGCSSGQASRIAYRFGVIIGDVVDNDGDLLGDGVNTASRLAGVAEPQTICVARSVYEQIRNKVPLNATDLGPKHLKNLPDPIHAFGLRRPASGQAAEFMAAAKDASPTPIAERRTSHRQWALIAGFAGLTLAASWSLWSSMANIAGQTPAIGSSLLAPAEVSSPKSTKPAGPQPRLEEATAMPDTTPPATAAVGTRPIVKLSLNQCADILERVQSGIATPEDRVALQRACK